jgi:hypothetical protein
MVSYQGAKAAMEQFKEWVDCGHLVDETGCVHLPPLMADWSVYVDDEPAIAPARVPTDDRDHAIELRGPGAGTLRTTVRVKPDLRVVR